MPTFVLAYLVTLALFAVVDFAWLGLAARSFYTSQLGEKLRPQPDLVAAALFYLVYAAGLTYFAVLPGLRGAGWTAALGLGAFLGFVAYATYDLTNQATLKDWPLLVTVVDLAWGTVLSAVVAAAACAALTAFGRG